MSLEEWQTELRRQFGRAQKFKLENLGSEPVFSDFRLANPQSGSSYRVTIRSSGLGDNFCSCPDFATNTLGTCKHIEFTLAKLERKPGGKTALRSPVQPAFSEIVLQYGAQRQVRFRPGTRCPAALLVKARAFFDRDGIMLPQAFALFPQFLAECTRLRHEVRCNDDALAFIAEVRDAKNRREQIDTAFANGTSSSAFDKLLKAKLYEYQREGALFAARAGRCLIGDEMGLGKTIQAIAAAEIMARHLGAARVLVVCPTSLKHQWEREISNFTDRSSVVIQGLRARRQELFASESFYKITNYDTIHRDLDIIANWSPDLVILDEAQRIKNWKTRAARSVKQIVAPYAIVLTGTPLENRLEELVSIVQFIDQHCLGPTFRFLANHQLLDEFGKVVGYRDLDSIGKSLSGILIRRRKDQVLKQLPPRLDKTFFVGMTPQQMSHHEENRETVALIVAKWRRSRFLSEADQRRLMIALQNMRMSCNSTFLLDQTTDHGSKADELLTLLDEIFEKPGMKVVVFSQWQRTHELIQRRLETRGYKHVLFTGSVPGPKRKALIEQFRDDEQCRVFLSTDAGGVGLNLQHASVVINMDLPWNPAVLEQRIGRVHRLGQSRPVQVVNFVAQGTIEEGMLSLIKFKKSMFAGVLDGGENAVFLGGNRLSRFMQSVDQASNSIPAPSIEEHRAENSTPDGDASETTNLDGAMPESTAPPSPNLIDLTASSTDSGSGAGGNPEPWIQLLNTGLQAVQQLVNAAQTGATGDGREAASQSALRIKSILHRDPSTGERYLRLPTLRPEAVNQIKQALTTIISDSLGG